MRNGSFKVQHVFIDVILIFQVIFWLQVSISKYRSNPIVILLMDKMLHQVGNVQSTIFGNIHIAHLSYVCLGFFTRTAIFFSMNILGLTRILTYVVNARNLPQTYVLGNLL